MNTDILRLALSEMRADVWAILPDRLAAMLLTISAVLEGGKAPEAARPAEARSSGGVAVIPMYGPIYPRGGSIMEMLFGGVSAERLAQTLQQAANDTNVSAIVLDVNSPGGSVAGVAEAAEAVRAAAKQKPVVAVSNHLAASAAYWIASQASRFVVTPSADVGSIGVFAAHEDWSKALDAAGIKVNLISAGKFKTEGNPYEPLTDEARAAIQARVDEFYGAFVKDVARGRGVSADDVRGGFGEGRVVGAKEAIKLGMADEIGTVATAVKLAGKLAEATPLGLGAELDYRKRRANAHL